jgi:hypothetical protein
VGDWAQWFFSLLRGPGELDVKIVAEETEKCFDTHLLAHLASGIGAACHKATPGAGGTNMRMMMLVQCPAEPFNTLVRNGTVGATMKKILDDTKPEAAYFSERDGKRGCVLIVDVPSAVDVPRLAEPWFLSFNADVEFRICMLPEDLGKANLEALGKKWG